MRKLLGQGTILTRGGGRPSAHPAPGGQPQVCTPSLLQLPVATLGFSFLLYIFQVVVVICKLFIDIN